MRKVRLIVVAVGCVAVVVAVLGLKRSGSPGLSVEIETARHEMSSRTEARTRAPNIILILVDTLRADRPGFMGNERQTSPHMSSFARTATVFGRHHAHSSRTGPSVASLFTSRHPGRHGVLNPLDRPDAKGRLHADQVTLAEILKDAGYSTHGVVANVNVSSRFGFGQGFDSYEFLRKTNFGKLINQRAKKILQDHPRTERPLFLYLHYMQPHSPYVAEHRFRRYFSDQKYAGPATGQHRQLDRIVAGEIEVDQRDIEHLETLYDREVRTFDERFGELLSMLRQGDWLRDSLVVLLSDHGEEFWDHGSLLHGYTLFEEQLHVPFVLHVPQRFQALQIDNVTRHIDIVPTLLDLARLPSQEGLRGHSLVPLLQGNDENWVPPVYARVQLKAVKTVKLQSLQLRDWKLVQWTLPQPRTQLFNLRVDPREREDRENEAPVQGARLESLLENLVSGREQVPSEMVELTGEETELLRSLGYLQ